jgi:hypothetical protein
MTNDKESRGRGSLSQLKTNLGLKELTSSPDHETLPVD